ncbi:unnamed protein product [Caenorhabditis bovis]|uniref:Palmitoyltransferase n=1 Tax=Caenorhabditis bovis TaxID=2654633 RepID=A0A8S1F4V0_9PELO|nr:unnamed protein product [Caenorhabditis bovis]
MAYADYVLVVWLVVPVFNYSMANNPRRNSSSEDSDSEEEAMIRRLERGSASEWTMCTRCQSFRPPRAHHCRICKRCVRKMDHHCPWVNNCVGELNQKYFLQFVIYVGVSCFYALFVLTLSWVLDDARGATRGIYSENVNHQKVLHSIFLAMESMLFGMFVIAVSCDQLSAIFTDETAIETVQRRGRGQYPNSTRRPRSSKVAMLRQVCGPGPRLLWLLPCFSTRRAASSRYMRSLHQLAQYDV